MTDVIASAEMIGIRPTGEKISISLRIGRPYLSGSSPETWACPVALEPLYRKLADITGTDSFHALCLASRLALTLLAGFKEDGGKLLFDDGTEVPVEAYLPLSGKGDA
jgi:hypothetical protein